MQGPAVKPTKLQTAISRNLKYGLQRLRKPSLRKRSGLLIFMLGNKFPIILIATSQKRVFFFKQAFVPSFQIIVVRNTSANYIIRVLCIVVFEIWKFGIKKLIVAAESKTKYNWVYFVITLLDILKKRSYRIGLIADVYFQFFNNIFVNI
eukprot:TRINITY_DN12612_c1_g1_i1.p2 TRINITY_DN12612_c1_g1~~TRINITY_DN12612_c1_g1_i1.p2  ORF type:complete len:150 (-),score=3.38 TRINITY_DN12612_c1_g1_i1:1162-1611(-)